MALNKINNSLDIIKSGNAVTKVGNGRAFTVNRIPSTNVVISATGWNKEDDGMYIFAATGSVTSGTTSIFNNSTYGGSLGTMQFTAAGNGQLLINTSGSNIAGITFVSGQTINFNEALISNATVRSSSAYTYNVFGMPFPDTAKVVD